MSSKGKFFIDDMHHHSAQTFPHQSNDNNTHTYFIESIIAWVELKWWENKCENCVKNWRQNYVKISKLWKFSFFLSLSFHFILTRWVLMKNNFISKNFNNNSKVFTSLFNIGWESFFKRHSLKENFKLIHGRMKVLFYSYLKRIFFIILRKVQKKT